MKVVDLEPRSDEWHKWRSTGIGASEIAVIMEDCPYNTPYQLWEKKCGYGKPTPLTGPMKYGISKEGVARQWINEHENLELADICVEDEITPYFKASLDGWDETHKVLMEIKCPTTEATIENARNHGAIHKYWYDQVQWQMMITRPERAYLAIYDARAGGCILMQQWPDMKLQKEMKEKAHAFWECVRTGKAPALTDRDYKEVDDSDLEVLLKQYEMADQQCKEGSAKKKELRDPIYAYGEGDNFKAHGWAIRLCQGRVSYDYEQMKNDGIDISKYEKTGSPSFKITKLKES